MINQVALTGHLARDIELKYTQGGTAVASFRLAVQHNYTNKDGQREADFINCIIWRKSAENLSNFVHKGSLIGVQGRLQSRSYDNAQGQRVFVTEVVVDNFALLESKAASQSRQSDQSGPQYQQSTPQQSQTTNYANQQQNVPQRQQTSNTSARTTPPDPFASNEQLDISDDDLPF